MSWGLKITFLYGGFVALILTLVVLSSRQHFDLVSKDYYADEIAYQKVIDADKNSTTLSSAIAATVTAENVTITFPAELNNKSLGGIIHFYSPVNAAWDRELPLRSLNNQMIVSRVQLRNTRYIMKTSFSDGDQKYYQETEINLNK